MGSEGARRRSVVYEDPQCPYCREFEDVSGDLLRREVAAGAVAVEYRIRSFLGNESVRAANALAAAAEAGRFDAGRFDELRREMFAHQSSEAQWWFHARGLASDRSGCRSGCPRVHTAVRQGRYESWVREIDAVFEGQDSDDTPYAVLDGQPMARQALYEAEALGALIRG